MLIIKKDKSFNVDHSTGINKDWDFWSHVLNGNWEPNTFEVLERFLNKEEEYLDIGAWIGPTVLFGSKFTKKCWAFEPDPKAFKSLELNLSLNPDIKNVRANQLAIGNTTGKVSFGSNSDQGDSMSSLCFSKTSWEVDSLTLQDCIDKYNIKNIGFIKMDIESGEKLVLPSIKTWIEKNQPSFYLALHTAWIEDKKSFLNDVKSVLSCYKNIYTSDKVKININDIDSLPGFTEILATNLEW